MRELDEALVPETRGDNASNENGAGPRLLKGGADARGPAEAGQQFGSPSRPLRTAATGGGQPADAPGRDIAVSGGSGGHELGLGRHGLPTLSALELEGGVNDHARRVV